MPLILFCCWLLSGCFHVATSAVRHLGTINETMTPQSIVCGTDGKIAIKAVSSYSRKATLNGRKTIPLPQYQPRERYVFVHPATIDEMIRQSTYLIDKNIRVDYVLADSPDVFPHGFFDSDLKYCQLPETFKTAGAHQYAMSEPVPYMHENKIYNVSFAKTKILSPRVWRAWWYNSAVIPAVIIDIPLAFAVVAVIPLKTLRNIDEETSI